MTESDRPTSRLRITNCVQCGMPFFESAISMSKFLGWTFAGRVARSDGKDQVTLLMGHTRANFLDAKLVSASIPLDVEQDVLDKLRCRVCSVAVHHSPAPL